MSEIQIVEKVFRRIYVEKVNSKKMTKTKKSPATTVKEFYQNELDDTSTLSYFSLYRYASSLDLFLTFLGVIFTFVKALGMPALIVVYGEFTTLLVDRTLGIGTSSSTIFLPLFGGGKILTNATDAENRTEIINDSIAYGILVTISTSIQFIAGIFAVDCFNHAALRQITRVRVKFFESLMKQEIGWYDVAGGSSNFAVQITDDVEKIREGIAEKVSHFLFLIIGFVICIVISFIYGWKLSLVVVVYLPIVVITNAVIGRLQSASSTKEMNAYSAAANVAEEVLSGIRTVFAFRGEKKEIDRYNNRLIIAKKAGERKGLLSGIEDGVMRFLFFGINALAFWYGVQLVLDDRDKIDKEYTPAVLMITFFGLICGADNLAKIAPFMETFVTARASASTVYRVIERASKIDSTSSNGKVINSNIFGNIQFKNVFFSYPSRPDVQILRGLNLDINAGETIALVGNSGNGKSTCLQLLERFYDPDQGDIIIDGCDIKQLNLDFLRSSIASVGQEPVLFSTTIGENIRYGNPEASDKEVIAAAKDSGAHDFIVNLPLGYNTLVGEKGSQMSGGQKQRIAIARALIQNPKILLLDEATSALDYQSEKVVQETLDRVCKGRTTIVVSHRLSAIRGADRIVFIDKGHAIEDGTHSELIASKGYYYDMITAGNLEDEIEADEKPFVDEKNNRITEYHEKVNGKQLFDEQENPQDYFRDIPVDITTKKDSKKDKSDIKYGKALSRILSMTRSDWLNLFMGSVSAILIGSALPIFAILFAEVYGALAMKDEAEAHARTMELCISFLAIGIILFVAAIIQSHSYAKTGANLVLRLRSMAFAALMRQECGWFDHEDHAVGVLSSRLTGDASNLQAVIGFPLSVLIQSIATFLIGIIMSFMYSVKLTLICLSAVPLSLISLLLESKHMSQSAIIEKESMEIGTKIATEAITNIKTVASLRQEKHMIARYTTEMNYVQKVVSKKIVWRGFVNSLAQSIPFFAYAVALYYGGLLIADGEIHFKNVIKVSEALLYGIMVMSQTLVFVPSITAAFVGAHRMFQIVDRNPLIASPNISNKSRKPDVSNEIEYKRIDFRYPTRPDVQILKNFNLKIEEGKTYAFVGPSGCGKSTCIQLLQRFYDPEHGRIFIGLDEISSDISLGDLRSKLGIVSQEPTLFEKSISENIAYGDNSRDVSMEEVIAAAKTANVHNFIVSLPTGYDTNLGSKGTQLSGGQKQRIAIARALIRDPKVLLLDEATSALDLHGEQIVQQALDSAQAGRTCLIIAHRLSTVQNADVICVLRNGSVAEMGNHSELLELGGLYARLYNAQK